MADTSNIEAMSDDEILATEPTPVEEGEEQEVPNSSGSDEDPSQGQVMKLPRHLLIMNSSIRLSLVRLKRMVERSSLEILKKLLN